MRRFLKWVVVTISVPLLLIQFVRPDRANPPIDAKRTIAAHVDVPPEVATILDRACNDCHSNATRWPWYSNVAPVSWMLADDVHEARRQLNFSEWAAYNENESEARLMYIAFTVRSHAMPLSKYTRLHPEARLNESDIEMLASWAERAVSK